MKQLLLGLALMAGLVWAGMAFSKEPPCLQSIEEIQAMAKVGGANLIELRGEVFKGMMDSLTLLGAPEGMKQAADGLLVITDRSDNAMLILVQGQCSIGIARGPRDPIMEMLKQVLKSKVADDGRPNI